MTPRSAMQLPSLLPLEHPNQTRNRYRKGGAHINLTPRQVLAADAMADRMAAALRATLPGSKLPRVSRASAIQRMVEEYGVIAGLIPPA